MIVKNESHIIKEALEGVINCVDLAYWVICDTGSVDGTQQLIRDFFKEHGIPGKLVQHEWEGFDVNRTWAFEECEKSDVMKHSNYIFVLDADDVPRGKFSLPKKMYADKYNLNYRSGTMAYVRPQLFKSGLRWEYRGVLHEFAEPRAKDRPSTGHIEGDYFIDSRRLGDRSLNPLKYYKDGIKIVEAYYKLQKEAEKLDGSKNLERLEQLAKNNPGKYKAELKKARAYMKSDARKKKLHNARYLLSRYSFYAGQSFRDYKDAEYSEKWYRIRANNPIVPNDEECYQARMEVANIFAAQKKSIEEVENLYKWAHEMYPIAAEPLYRAALHFNEREEFEKAYEYGKKANALPFPVQAQLFVAQDIYDWKAAKEYAYAAMKTGRHRESFRAIEDKLVKGLVPHDHIRFLENIRNMNLDGGKLFEENRKYPAEIVKRLSQPRKTRSVKCVIAFTNWDMTTATINSFLRCCTDVEMIEKWVVYGSTEQPLLVKLYPFIQYIVDVKDPVNVLDYADANVNIFMEGRWAFMYETAYIGPNLGILGQSSVAQIQMTMMNGDRMDIDGHGFNMSKVALSVPSIFKKGIQNDSLSVSRRWKSCLRISEKDVQKSST